VSAGVGAATVDRGELARLATRAPVRGFLTWGAVVAVVGAALVAWTIATGHPDRASRDYLIGFLFWTSLAQALVIVAATQKLAKGHWAGLIIRFAEAAVAFLFASVILYGGLVLGRAFLFGALPVDRSGAGFWFGTTFFLIRNWVIVALMAWLSWRFVRRDLAPDQAELAQGKAVETDPEEKGRIARDAAILVVSWAFGYTLIGFDLVMTLAPRWESNLYGAFFFMGSFLCGLAALAVLSHLHRRVMGLQHLISAKQMHDLGKLIFGFTVFWGYLMWAQFLVIWYGNIPEETYFVFYRLWGPWRPVGTAVFLMVFVIPFIGLLGVKPKKYAPTFLAFSGISILGLWLERYLEIVPSLTPGQPPSLGVPELGTFLLFGGLFLLSYGWFAGRYPMISPRLAADTLEREHSH